jgi:hypothetical protein
MALKPSRRKNTWGRSHICWSIFVETRWDERTTFLNPASDGECLVVISIQSSSESIQRIRIVGQVGQNKVSLSSLKSWPLLMKSAHPNDDLERKTTSQVNQWFTLDNQEASKCWENRITLTVWTEVTHEFHIHLVWYNTKHLKNNEFAVDSKTSKLGRTSFDFS